MGQPLTGAELTTSDYVLLLEISYAGQTFRFASEDVIVETATGSELVYDGQLDDLDYEAEFDLFSDSPNEASISVEVIMPVDVALLVQQGHDLAQATGELSMWVPGRTYEERVILIQGTVTEPTYGSMAETVEFSLEANPFSDKASYPAAGLVIDEDTWPDAVSRSTSRVYPVVFGKPGALTYPGGDAVPVPGSPAYLVLDDATGLASVPVLVAGHHCQTGTVTVLDTTTGNRDVRTLYNQYDALNQPVALVYLDGSASGGDMIRNVDGEYWIIWDGTAAGHFNRQRTKAMLGAGEVLEHMLDQSSLGVDRGRLAAIKDRLNAVLISGFLDTTVTPYDWIQDNLLDILPVSVMSGPKGLYAAIWDLEATSHQALLDLVAETPGVTGQMVRNGKVDYDRDDLLNELTVRFAQHGQNGDYYLSHTLSGAPGARHSAPHVKVSYARYGLRADAIETNMVTDIATAKTIARWKTRAFAFPRRTVSYVLDRQYASLAAGDVVTLTDAELHWAQQVALVKSLSWKREGIAATFLLVENPAAERRV